MTTQVESTEPTDVYLEVGTKRVFACALAWPGWCRSGKTETDALDALAAYAMRYAVVAREAGIAFPEAQRSAFRIVERLAGSAGYTDFGAPGAVPARDREPLTEAEATRQVALLRASWVIFDRCTARAGPANCGCTARGTCQPMPPCKTACGPSASWKLAMMAPNCCGGANQRMCA
jgi:hypothetical protein